MPDSNFSVRPIEEDEINEWFRLRRLLWDESTEREHRVEMMDILEHTETQLVLVAEYDNRLVGFLEASIRPFVEDCYSDQVGYLEGWFVENEYRKHGLGRQLVETAEKWAKSKGCREMASDSEIGNELSLNAHLSLGYQETSRLVHLRKELI